MTMRTVIAQMQDTSYHSRPASLRTQAEEHRGKSEGDPVGIRPASEAAPGWQSPG